MNWGNLAYRAAVLALLGAIWWQVGGADSAERAYWKLHAMKPSAREEPAPARGPEAPDLFYEDNLRAARERAQQEAWRASQPTR